MNYFLEANSLSLRLIYLFLNCTNMDFLMSVVVQACYPYYKDVELETQKLGYNS